MANQLGEDSLWIGTSEGILFGASIVNTEPWDPDVWRDHINEYRKLDFDGFYPNPRVANYDGIGGLFFLDLFIIHRNGHAWFSHILFGRDWEEYDPDFNAWADLVESCNWGYGPQGDISDVAPVPEPATLLLLGTGLIGLGSLGRKKLFKTQRHLTV